MKYSFQPQSPKDKWRRDKRTTFDVEVIFSHIVGDGCKVI